MSKGLDMGSLTMANTEICTFLFFSALLFCTPPHTSAGVPPAVIAFGDSLLDPGNNNVITFTAVKANHRPYGCNFPGEKPTGRFSDGMILGDLVVSSLGIKETLPAYLDPDLKDGDLASGVSFASSGSGLDDLTSANVNVFSMDSQLAYFREYITRLEGVMGKEKAKKNIKDTLFIIATGSNDILNYYGVSLVRRLSYTCPEYHDFLLSRLFSFVQKVYLMGGRLFAISGLPPIGSLPIMTALGRTAEINKNVVSYNRKLQNLIVTMMYAYNRTNITYVDSYTDLHNMIQQPKKYGFIEATRGCCGLGKFQLGPLCNNIVSICDAPSNFLFWDAVHPTELAYKTLWSMTLQNLLSITT